MLLWRRTNAVRASPTLFTIVNRIVNRTPRKRVDTFASTVGIALIPYTPPEQPRSATAIGCCGIITTIALAPVTGATRAAGTMHTDLGPLAPLAASADEWKSRATAGGMTWAGLWRTEHRADVLALVQQHTQKLDPADIRRLALLRVQPRYTQKRARNDSVLASGRGNSPAHEPYRTVVSRL
jgi:hypothetical protein